MEAFAEQRKKVLRVGVAILLLIVAVVAIVGFQSKREKMSRAWAGQTALDALRGDFTGVATRAQEFIATHAPDNRYYDDALVLLEVSQFWSDDPQEQANAIRQAKERYIFEEGNPVAQAAITNRILEYLQAYDEAVFTETFTGPPFSPLLAEGDFQTSVKNLAEHSLSLWRTSTALLQVAQWHATQGIRHYDGFIKLSKSEIEAHRDAVVEALEEADALYAEEERMIKGQVFAPLYLQNFFFFRGYLYGVLSLYDKKYLSESDYSFQQVTGLYEDSLDAEGVGAAMLETRVPYALLDQALFWRAADPKGNKETIKANLDRIAQMVNNRPDIHERFFSSFISQVQGYQTGLGMWLTASRIERVSQFSPAFRDFLEENRWEFEKKAK